MKTYPTSNINWQKHPAKQLQKNYSLIKEQTKIRITALNNSVYSKPSDTISTNFFGVKGERLSSLKCLPFHGELMQLYQIMQKYLLYLVLYKQRFLLIHSIFQDSHTVSNLNPTQHNKGSIDKLIFYINKMLNSHLCI